MKRYHVTRDDNTLRRKLRKVKQYQRVVTDICEELGVTRQHVWAVINDERPSKRVASALAKRIDAIDREAAA